MEQTIRVAPVSENGLKALHDYAREFELAIRSGDGDRAVTAARTIEEVIIPILNEVDPEGVCSPAIFESNGRYIGPDS